MPKSTFAVLCLVAGSRAQRAPRVRKLFSVYGLIMLACIASPAFAQVTLGSAQGFAVLGGSTVTNTGTTNTIGSVGVSPGTAITGFPPGVVSGGTIHAGDATGAQAQADLTTAYNAAASTTCNVDLTGQDLGGLTLTPGVYCFSTAAVLTGTLTLDLQGNSSAFFLFKIGSTLTTASNSEMKLINSGGSSCAQNIFWQVGSSATLGSGSSSAGSLLALTSITLNSSAALSGEALAMNGAVTLDSNSVTICAVSTPVRLQEFGID